MSGHDIAVDEPRAGTGQSRTRRMARFVVAAAILVMEMEEVLVARMA